MKPTRVLVYPGEAENAFEVARALQKVAWIEGAVSIVKCTVFISFIMTWDAVRHGLLRSPFRRTASRSAPMPLS
jgi:hypothetical protein